MRILFISVLIWTCTTAIAQNFTVKFDHEAIKVKDVETSHWFYTRVIGLEEIKSPFNRTSIRWYKLTDGSQLHIIQGDTSGLAFSKSVHFAVRVSDLDAFMVWAQDKDIAFESWSGELGTSNTRPDEIRQVYLQDPDGYWLEVNGK